MRLFINISFLVLITGCTAIPPSKGIYYGNAEHQQGNYEHAIEHYTAALQLAEKQNYKPHIATAKYGLGRTYGQLCKFDLAEKNLKAAVELEEQISGGKGANLSQDYLELARLYYDYGHYKNSTIYFKKAIPVVEDLGIIKSDPIGYAIVLEDYARALNEVGDTETSNRITAKIEKLKSDNPNKSQGFYILRYNSDCMLNNSLNQTGANDAPPGQLNRYTQG